MAEISLDLGGIHENEAETAFSGTAGIAMLERLSVGFDASAVFIATLP
jgi:hypothetical protein